MERQFLVLSFYKRQIDNVVKSPKTNNASKPVIQFKVGGFPGPDLRKYLDDYTDTVYLL